MKEVKCEHKNIIQIIKTVLWCRECGAIKSNNTNSEWKYPIRLSSSVPPPSGLVALDEKVFNEWFVKNFKLEWLYNCPEFSKLVCQTFGIPEASVPSVEEIEEVIELYNGDDCPIDGSKVTWFEYRNHFAKAIHSLLKQGKDKRSV